MLRDSELAPLGIMGLAILAGFVVKNVTDDFWKFLEILTR